MPVYPHYVGPPLPPALNPLDLGHYLLLLNWIFFNPSRLRQYLYRADSQLYRRRGLAALRESLRVPAYRNFLGMSGVLAFVIFVAAALWIMRFNNSGPAWIAWILGVSWWIGGGLSWAITLGVARGVCWAWVGIVISLAGGVGENLMASIIWTMAMGIVLEIAIGSTFSVTGGVILGISVDFMFGFLLAGIFWAGGGTPFKSVLLGGGFWSLILGLGTLRSLSYIFHLGSMLGNRIKKTSGSPILQNELIILPLPGLDHWLWQAFNVNLQQARKLVRYVLRNPFQRWAVSRVLTRRWGMSADPLAEFYEALEDPELNEYVTEPLSSWELQSFPSAREIWLGEVSGVFVDETGGYSVASAWLGWRLTRPLRAQSDRRIAPLAVFLMACEDKGDPIQLDEVSELLKPAMEGVAGLPHGLEIAVSLESLIGMAKVEKLSDVVAFRDLTPRFQSLATPWIRPQIMEALHGLGDVAVEVERYLEASSASIQAGALNRAVGMLNELRQYTEPLNLPERTLLRLAIGQWQNLIGEAAGRLGEQALREMAPLDRLGLSGGDRQATFWSRPAEPFPNPYKTGAPVLPPLFVGRQDIFSRIQDVWRAKVNPDSVILYGHRRMGKSSILRNLRQCAPPGSLLVVADLKGETALIENTAQLLRSLADALIMDAGKCDIALPEPVGADYQSSSEASLAFRRLMRQLLVKMPAESSLILALDEFEALDHAVNAGKIGREIYDYLRTLSQEPRITLVFAGLHTLDEMSRDYKEAFFDSYVNLRVSYLSFDAAERLIARPTPDFRLNYHSEVIAEIIRETCGQPLMVQRICQELVNHLNHELFDLQKEREARILPGDLKAVLNDEFVRNETRYFSGIWGDQVAGREGAEAVMMALAEVGPAQPLDLAGRVGSTDTAIGEVLRYLEIRDLVHQQDGMWDLCIPLMRRWLQLRKGDEGDRGAH